MPAARPSRTTAIVRRDRARRRGWVPAKTPAANVKWLETETLKILSSKETKDKLYQAGFLVRAEGAAAAWARVIKEIDEFKRIIDQAGIPKL
jgi:tripartite-type tricarboxylate transporter receptor subunit TctC